MDMHPIQYDLGDLQISHPSVKPFVLGEPDFALHNSSTDVSSSLTAEDFDLNMLDEVCLPPQTSYAELPQVAITKTEPASTPRSAPRTKPKSTVAKKAPSSKKKENPNEVFRECPELLEKALEMGAWSQFFRGKAVEEAFEKIVQLVNRPAHVRQQEARDNRKPGQLLTPKRPINRFMLYRKTYQTFVVAHCKLVRHQMISKLCGVAWHLESDDVKAKFMQLQENDSDGLEAAFEGYKFNPAKNGNKKNQKAKARSVKKASKRLQDATNLSTSVCQTSPVPHMPVTPPTQRPLLNYPKSSQNINYVYWSNPMQPLHGSYQGPPALNNFYLKRGNVQHYLPNAAQFTMDPMLGSQSAMVGFNTPHGLPLGGNMDLSYRLPGAFPLIAQQHDGSVLTSPFNDFGLLDDFNYGDFLA
ncbi:hypothetical protein Micbo1qcDRAFT_224105 [Microdochium bolleyi]|uniref:HMG box domain-containing protein n=1 Tax=Microdochium bolleyi TaxID=196109 RepID=A0A136J4S0_9PEZI|nr:hypothetical protein Micbo1qcDRAFT_224105 [Microdochium bolleyi]